MLTKTSTVEELLAKFRDSVIEYTAQKYSEVIKELEATKTELKEAVATTNAAHRIEVNKDLSGFANEFSNEIKQLREQGLGQAELVAQIKAKVDLFTARLNLINRKKESLDATQVG